MADFSSLLIADRRKTLAGVPEGYDALILADLARVAASTLGRVPILHIAREDKRLSELADQIAFFAPDIDIVSVPAWDCLPYDRVSPNGAIMARRMAALSTLARQTQAEAKKQGQPFPPQIVLTTIAAATQRVPSRSFVSGKSFAAKLGQRIDTEALIAFLSRSGYSRASQVTEPGEFAQRGGLIDIFPADAEQPVRLDLFGDELDQLRTFDPLSQRTTGNLESLDLRPLAEFSLEPDTIKRFRRAYVESFGAVSEHDPLYEAISEGRAYQGAEHWLPLFHDRMETLFDYLPGALLTLDHQVPEAAKRRFEAIRDYHQSRKEQAASKKSAAGSASISSAPQSLSSPYKPLPPAKLYLAHDEWDDLLDERAARLASPFAAEDGADLINFHGKSGRDFAPERLNRELNVYECLRDHVRACLKQKKRVMIAAYSDGARQRMKMVLADHGMVETAIADSWQDVSRLPAHQLVLVVLALEHGFETPDLVLITEQDLLGDRLIRKGRKSRRAEDFLRDASSLSPGDLVVHSDHGVGRFIGLHMIEVSGAPHDCVALVYRDGDKLFVPVENIDVLTRYGSEEMGGELDKLGGHAWQAKKARMKKRIRDMAEELIKIAAARAMKQAEQLEAPTGLYDEFARHRGCHQRSAVRQTDGQADLRRCGLWQNRSGPARRVHRGHVGPSGGDHCPHHPPCPSALSGLYRTFSGIAHQGGTDLAAGLCQGCEGHQGRPA
jgi:transcription-repair coupling factor (superfamily II helicase)